MRCRAYRCRHLVRSRDRGWVRVRVRVRLRVRVRVGAGTEVDNHRDARRGLGAQRH